jgi:hypothetical protein
MGATQRGRTASRERTARDNPAVVCRLVDEACHASNLGIPDAVLAPGGGAADPAAPGAGGLDREHIKQALRLCRAAGPDARWTIVDQSAAEDMVVTRLCVGRTWVGCGASPRPAEKGGDGGAHRPLRARPAGSVLGPSRSAQPAVPTRRAAVTGPGQGVVAVARALRVSEASAGQMSLQGRSTVSGA